MKTFEQFKTWMEDNQVWDEYLYEFYNSKMNKESPKEKYDQVHENIFVCSFVWTDSVFGPEYWKNLHEEWIKFYNDNMKQYEFVYVSERVACVKMPKDATTTQIGFVTAALQKECQEITEFEWEGGNLYGLRKKMQLKKL